MESDALLLSSNQQQAEKRPRRFPPVANILDNCCSHLSVLFYYYCSDPLEGKELYIQLVYFCSDNFERPIYSL